MTFMEQLENMRKKIGSYVNPEIGTAAARPVTMDASNVSQMPEEDRLALAEKVAKLKVGTPPSASGLGKFRGVVPAIEGAAESTARAYDYLTTGFMHPPASTRGPVSATVDQVLSTQTQPPVAAEPRGAGVFEGESEADPMRRLEMQREAYRAANRERYQDIASELRTGGAKPLPTAAEIADKREFDRRRALIETMAEGPDKQDALARLQDEQTARAELSPFDRFEGLKGSPDAKAREGRMAAYQAKLDQLTAERVMTKRDAAAAMANAKKIEKEQFDFEQKVKIAQDKQEDRDNEEALLNLGIAKKESIAAANAGFRSMATFNGKINGKGPKVNGAQVTEMFLQLEPEERMSVLEQAAVNAEWSETDPKAAFMSAFTAFMQKKLRQQQS